MRYRHHKQIHIHYKRFITVILLFILCLLAVVVGLRSLLHRQPQYDDAIIGSAYLAADMPIPTATPKPTMPPDFIVEYARHEADFIEVYNQYEQRIAYLTFDDGPTATITPQILDILKAKGVPATFFVLGRNVDAHPDLAQRAVNEGHVLANHSYTHEYNILYNNDDINLFKEDIEKADRAIVNAVGEKGHIRLFRFPGGSFEAKKDPQKQILLELGYKYIDWNALTGDAEGLNVSPETQLANLQKTVGKKRNAVILMHDATTKQTTVDALPAIIDYLKNEGFVFKTLQDAWRLAIS